MFSSVDGAPVDVPRIVGSMLSDTDISREINGDNIVVDPYDEQYLQPASLELTLSDEYIQYDNSYAEALYPSEYNGLSYKKLRRIQRLTLNPGEFLLASTIERITLPRNIAAKVEGKSSLGRLGLMVHATAGFVDPGFSGQLTLELSNVNSLPIVLTEGMKIAQLCFFYMHSEPRRAYGDPYYGSKYQFQSGPTASRTNASAATL